MAITSLNSVNKLIAVMVKCGVLFEVRTEFLNICTYQNVHIFIYDVFILSIKHDTHARETLGQGIL
jgi:hypothetical protein